jgi:nucleotide-binding universal stress UspA family protein
MKKILVPTDFSEFAESAFKFAIQFAQLIEGQITLLHIVYSGHGAKISISESQSEVEALFDTARLQSELNQLQSKCKGLLEANPFPNINYQIISGNTNTTIVEYAKEGGYDLIIMGTQGEGNSEHWLVGSNTEKVVRMSSVPVLSVRKLPKNFKMKDFVLACDLDTKHELPIDKVEKFRSLFGAHLHLVYINTPSSFVPTHLVRQKVTSFAKKYNLNEYTFHLYCDFVEDDGINHFAESIDADLIITISHQRKGLARLLSGSISEGVVFEARIPVLNISFQ